MKSMPLVLAIEFPRPTVVAPYFDRSLAQGLANQLAFELAKHLPNIEGLGLVWMAAVYDQAQLLRPGFPVFRALSELYKAGLSVGQLPQVLTLQARRAQAPLPTLQVDERLLGGPMVLVPICLLGSESQIDTAQALLETKLLDSGLTDARTALFLNQALGADAEHARLMTLDDLAALTAIQLENMDFADVWRAVEYQLFTLREIPADSEYLAIQGGLLKINLQSTTEADFSEANLARLAQRKLRERQVIGLLQAHELAFEFHFGIGEGHSESSPEQSYWLHWLEAASVENLTPISHPSTGLLCVKMLGANARTLGFAHPLKADAWTRLQARFASA
jgi:hypothetical protein